VSGLKYHNLSDAGLRSWAAQLWGGGGGWAGGEPAKGREGLFSGRAFRAPLHC
jgi:hypothetical protein